MRNGTWTVCVALALGAVAFASGCQTVGAVNQLATAIVGTAVKATNAIVDTAVKAATTPSTQTTTTSPWVRNYGGQPDRNFAGSHSTSTSRSAKSNGSRPVTKRAKRGTYTRYGVEIDETSTAKSRRRGHKPTNSAWK
jgi:hypothetical protein